MKKQILSEEFLRMQKLAGISKLLKEDKYDIEDPNSLVSKLNDNEKDVSLLNGIIDKYEDDIVLMWLSSGEQGERSGEDYYKVYDIENPDSLVSKLNNDKKSVAILNQMTEKYGEDVVLMWMSGGEYGEE